LCKYYLLPYLEQFHTLHPDIRIRVTNRTTPETVQLLKEGKIDFGLVSLPTVDKQVEIRQSAPLEDCLVGGRSFISLSGKGLAMEEIGQYPLLMLEPGASTRSFLDRFADSCGVVLTPEFELGSVDLLVQFALRGFGLTFVPRLAVAGELAAERLVEIPVRPSLPERQMGIAALRGVPLSAAAKAFIALLPW
ncbi:MAG: LysR family transcriptional regulator, partial [Paenibacillaceae bacterium]|nr:LysR family transcriptional regulator [Paenibacillaceae bacterium]